MSRLHDVIIIGAGAIGSYLAGELAGLGYDVCVLERRPQPGSKTCCTGIVSAECISLLQPPPDIIQLKANSVSAFAPSGRSLRLERAEVQAYVLHRPALDLHLATMAERAGARFFFSTSAEDIQVNARVASVTASGSQGNLNLSGKAAVIANGFPSSFTKKAGLGQIADHAMGAQTEAEYNGVDEVEVYAGNDIAPGFFAWLVPLNNGRAKIGLITRKNPNTYIYSLLQKLASSGRIKLCGYPISYGAVPLKPLVKTYGERIIAVGDAAGQVKPTTGGGIYFGLLAARAAADTLHTALTDNDLSRQRLAGYQKGWHRLLKRELSIDHWAHRFYRSLNDQQMDHIFSIIKRHGIHESILASPDITFDWHSHVILDVIRHRSLQKALVKLHLGSPPLR